MNPSSPRLPRPASRCRCPWPNRDSRTSFSFLNQGGISRLPRIKLGQLPPLPPSIPQASTANLNFSRAASVLLSLCFQHLSKALRANLDGSDWREKTHLLHLTANTDHETEWVEALWLWRETPSALFNDKTLNMRIRTYRTW